MRFHPSYTKAAIGFSLVMGGLGVIATIAAPTVQEFNLSAKGTMRDALVEAKILVVGDMFFDRYIRQVAERRGGEYLFSCIEPLLKEADGVVGNLEGPITWHESKSVGSAIGSPDNFTFTFPPGTAELLAKHNILAVSLGNNHIGNFGADGIGETKRFLTQAGIGYFGGLAGDSPVYRTAVNGVELSFVGYNQFGGDDREGVAHTIAAERAAGHLVIVMAHWGEEYRDTSADLRPIAALFAGQGAAAVIGSHPHIVLPHETIGGVPVYYSLGNFIFDQYFDEDVTRGLAVLLSISSGGAVRVSEHAVTLLPDGRTCPA